MRRFSPLNIKAFLVFILIFCNFIATAQTSVEEEILLKKIGNAEATIDRLKAIAKLSKYYEFNVNFHKADSLLNTGIILAEKSGDKKAVFWSYLNYGFDIRMFPQDIFFDKYVQRTEKALKIAEDENWANEKVLATSALAYLVFYKNIEKAGKYLNDADINDEAVTNETRAHYYISKSNLLFAKSENVNAFKSLLLAKKYAEKSGDYYSIEKAYTFLGFFFFSINEFDKAAKWYTKKMEMNYKEEDFSRHMSAQYRIGKIFLGLKDTSKAIGQFNHVLLLADSLKITDYTANQAVWDLFEIFCKQKNIVEADRIIEKYKVFNYGMKFGALGYYDDKIKYFKNINTDSVKFYIKKALRDIDTGSYGSLTDTYRINGLLNTAILLNSFGEYKAALNNFERVLNIDKDNSILNIADYTNIYKELQSIYSLLGDYKKAFEASRKYKIYQDSLDAQSRKEDILKAEIADVEETQRKEEEAELKATERRHNLQYMGISIAGFSMLLILLVVGFFNVPKWLVRVLGFLGFIFLFEFIILILDTKIHHLTHGEPLPAALFRFITG